MSSSIPTSVDWLHSLPRYNFTFSNVDNAFEFDDLNYAQSLGLFAAPLAVIMLLSFAVLIWACCSRSSANAKRASDCTVWGCNSLYALGLIACVTMAVVSFLYDSSLHGTVDTSIVIVNNTLISYNNEVDNLYAALEAMTPFAAPYNITQQALPPLSRANSSINDAEGYMGLATQVEVYRNWATMGILVVTSGFAVVAVALWRLGLTATWPWSLALVIAWFVVFIQSSSSGLHASARAFEKGFTSIHSCAFAIECWRFRSVLLAH
jgi:hypothetical protein